MVGFTNAIARKIDHLPRVIPNVRRPGLLVRDARFLQRGSRTEESAPLPLLRPQAEPHESGCSKLLFSRILNLSEPTAKSQEPQLLTFNTAAPLTASCLSASSARLESLRSKIWVWVRMGISAATFRKSIPSWRVLLATLRTTRSW